MRTYRTTTLALLELRDWLAAEGCTHVAMESTGVYWKPVWHALEDGVVLVLANAMHIKNVPGRKTDVNDAMWIADLLAHGLIRGSFVPPRTIQDLRDLTRTRSQLTKERARHVQRIQKTLEDANIKLTGLVQDILGVTGRAILRALVAGETDPDGLVPCHLHGRLKATREQLVEALRGSVREHHRFLLRLHLTEVESLEAVIRQLEQRIETVLEPHRQATDRLSTIPGVSKTTAPILLAEIGLDMSRFPTADHLVSWAGLCPVNDESAGKRRSTRLRSGDPWLRSALVQAAWPAARKRNSALRGQYLRIKARRGPKKAAVAVAASILTAAYFILLRGVPYQECGPLHPVQPDRQKTASRLIRKLKDLGLRVEVQSAA